MEKKKLFLICLITGVFGGHYFVIGNYKKGFLYLFTAGLMGLGWVYDLIRIAASDNFATTVEKKEELHRQKVYEQKTAIIEHEKAEAEKIQSYRNEGVPYCPKCHSTSLTANKKGFGVGKAATGAFLAGPYGVLAGGLGSGKITITCLNCGHKFKPKRR